MSLEVYKSSAGSGKTTTLVRKFLSVALSSDNPEEFRNILAITFTNKAAGEMKERILGALWDLGKPAGLTSSSNAEWAQEFCLNNHISPEHLKGRASDILSRILHKYSEFSVSTIDKFSHRIIRQFAFDLGISSDFTVELDSDLLLREAVHAVINRAGEDPVLTRFLVSFIIQKAESEKGWNIEQDIENLGKKLFDEASEQPLRQLRELSLDDFLLIKKTFQHDIKTFHEQLALLAREMLMYLADNGLSETHFYKKIFPDFLRKITREQKPDKDFYEKIKKYAQGDSLFRKEDLKKPQTAAHHEKIKQMMQVLLEFYHKNSPDYLKKSDLDGNLYALGSLTEIYKALKEISARQNLIHISEFNRLISSAIKDQPAPYVYERLGEKYRCIFIDEFQDTSSLQWQNLVPLVDHVLASGGAAMLVGDAKQSIYRWRGGESEQFRMLPMLPGNDRLSQERSSAFSRLFSPKTLDNNHRSAPQIVEFNNAFFKSIKSQIIQPWMDVYDDVSQYPKSKIEFGAVWINPLEHAIKLNSEKSDVLVYHETLAFIRLTTEKHQSRLKDITILTRNSKKGSDIAAFLLGQGVNVISPESILLNRSYKVNALIAGLNCLIYPHDAPSLISWLYADSPNPIIESEKIIGDEQLSELKSLFYQSESPSAVLHELCRLKNWSPLNDIFLQFLFERVSEYEGSANAPSCYDFVLWWTENESRFNVVLPEGLDAVQVMTIHKAKGLQFPVVIFPFFDFDTSLRNDSLMWADLKDNQVCGLTAGLISGSARSADFIEITETERSKVLLDNLNLLYVALTRACHHLALIPSYPKNGTGSVISSWLKLFLQNNPPDHITDAWLVYGCHDAAVPQKKVTPESADRPDRLPFKFFQPVWARPQYSFTENNATQDEGIFIHEQLSNLALGSNSESLQIKKIWNDILNHDELNFLSSPEANIFPEREICDSNGNILRPDLLIEYKGAYRIIDYKTGTPNPEHILQIKNYAAALKEAGLIVEDCWLIYITDSFEAQKIAC
jgi:ATP-dependent exoDNAse (exonuclease V) beta subunit